MRPDVRNDLEASKEAFERIVKPALIHKYGLTDIVSLEDHSNPLYKEMDMISGMDYYSYGGKNGPSSLASRILWHPDKEKFDMYSNNITIRCLRRNAETEWQKIPRAIKNDAVYPIWTIMTHICGVKGDTIYNGTPSIIIAKTKPLYKHVEIDLRRQFRLLAFYKENRINGELDGTGFYAINVNDLNKAESGTLYSEWEKEIRLTEPPIMLKINSKGDWEGRLTWDDIFEQENPRMENRELP